MLENAEYLRDHSIMADDRLSDIVAMARARCHISTSFAAADPWALHYPPPRQIKFMAIVKGTCCLRFEAEGPPLRIGTSDVLVLSGPRRYTLASALDVPPIDANKVFADPAAACAARRP